jgi:hypothetical protein
LANRRREKYIYETKVLLILYNEKLLPKTGKLKKGPKSRGKVAQNLGKGSKWPIN